MGQSVPTCTTMWSRVAVVLLSAASCHAGLLGAGTGEGSCAAAPYRALAVKWPAGCPATAPCCSEYGYCQTESNWHAGVFRDCNGVSNGIPLPEETIHAENIAASHGDTAAAGLLVVPAGAGIAAAPVVSNNVYAAVPVATAAGVGLAGGAALVAGGAGFGLGGHGLIAGGAGYGAFADVHGNYVSAPGAYAAAPAAYAAATHGAYAAVPAVAGYGGYAVNHATVPAYTSA